MNRQIHDLAGRPIVSSPSLEHTSPHVAVREMAVGRKELEHVRTATSSPNYKKAAGVP